MLGKLVNTLVQTAKAKSTKVEDFLTGSKESVKKEQEIDALCISSDLNSDSFFEVFDAQYKSIMAKYSGEYSREYEVGAIVGNLQQLVRKSKEIAVAMRNVDHRKKYDSVVMHLSRKIKRYESKETLQAYLKGRSIKTLIYLVEYRHDPNCVSDQEFADGEALLERIVKIKDVKDRYSEEKHNKEIAASKSPVRNVTEVEYEDLLDEKRVLVVDFYGNQCGPCKQFLPIFLDVAKEYGDKATFVTLNASTAKDVNESQNLRGVPTTIIYQNGLEVDRVVGLPKKDDFLDVVKKYV